MAGSVDRPGTLERFRRSLVLRQAALAALVAVATALAAGVGAFWVSRILLQDEIHLRLSAAFEEHRSAIVGFVETKRRAVEELTGEAQLGGLMRAHDPGLHGDDEWRNAAQLLLEALAARPGVRGLWLSDRQGNLIAFAGAAPVETRAARPAGLGTDEAAIWLGPPQTRSGRSVIELASSVLDDAGRPLGLVQMRADLSRVEDVLERSGDRGPLQGFRIGYRTADGLRVIPADRPEEAALVPALVEGLDRASRGQFGFYQVGSGSPYLLLSRPLSGTDDLLRGWALVATAPVETAYAPLHRASRITAIVVAAILAIGAWAVFLATRLLGEPLHELDRSARAIALGDFTARVHVRSEDEVGRIASAFNELTSHFAGERARTAQRVAERTSELAEQNEVLRRRNRDLDQFARAAAHDLRAPLRAIENLANWVAEDSGQALGGQARADLDDIRTRAGHLKRQLTDLLEYSRVGQRREPSVEVDTAALVDDAVADLELPEGVHIHVAKDLPFVRAPEAALHTVFQNLVGNAIEHRDPKRETAIRVTSHEDDDAVEFAVSDDGPGIPQEFHERIFELFESLNEREDGASSGMGLAIVKKTVEHFGGRIRVESSPGAGATFRFTLPKVHTQPLPPPP